MTITTDRISKSAKHILEDMNDEELRDQIECDPEAEELDDYMDWELGEDNTVVKGSRKIECKSKSSAKWLLKALEKHTYDGVVI
jgi:hypothetical protein